MVLRTKNRKVLKRIPISKSMKPSTLDRKYKADNVFWAKRKSVVFSTCMTNVMLNLATSEFKKMSNSEINEFYADSDLKLLRKPKAKKTKNGSDYLLGDFTKFSKNAEKNIWTIRVKDKALNLMKNETEVVSFSNMDKFEESVYNECLPNDGTFTHFESIDTTKEAKLATSKLIQVQKFPSSIRSSKEPFLIKNFNSLSDPHPKVSLHLLNFKSMC
jgi:hypothetical protein